MRFQVPPKSPESTVDQIICQWIPDCWSDDGFQTCCGEHVEQLDSWRRNGQIIDTGKREHRT